MAAASAGANDVALVVDVLVTWIGAAALTRYVMVVHGRGERSALERRARFLAAVLASLLFVRGFSWLAPTSVMLGLLTFVPVTLLPLATTVFMEGMLRRHAPRWMKTLAVTATVVAFLANLLRLFTSDPKAIVTIGYIALAALLVTLSALGVLLFRRDRATLSRSENALIRACLIVTLIALPLVVTDFRFDLGWPMVRLGTLGALLFCYTLLRHPQENAHVWYWVSDVARLVGKAVLIGLFIAVALRPTNGDVLVPMFVLGVAIVLASAVFDRLRDIQRTTPHTELLEWLARPLPASVTRFARELRLLPLTSDAVLLDESDLVPYDRAALVAAFPKDTVVQSLSGLRALRSSPDAQAARAADELTDLLERNGATHVGMISIDPVRLLITTTPELPGMGDVELAFAAVVRRAQRISERERHVLTV